jgi:diacylglycerol kinase (ATP)
MEAHHQGGHGVSLCTILLNEKAGALHATPGEDEIRKMVEQMGWEAEVLTMTTPEESRKKLRELKDKGVERVAVAGGDGTVAMAVQELAHSETALGIIPQGTANNFANALRLPMDLPGSLRLLQEGCVEEVDLGFVNGRYFTESAGVGLFADGLAAYGDGHNKNPFMTAYALFKIIFSLKARGLKLTLDGETNIERAVYCACANSFRMAHLLPIAPSAKVTDGELDVIVFGNLTRGELVSYYKALRAQMHLTLPKTQSYKAKKIKIESRTPMAVHADDQVVGTTPVTIEVRPKALKVLVDRL